MPHLDYSKQKSVFDHIETIILSVEHILLDLRVEAQHGDTPNFAKLCAVYKLSDYLSDLKSTLDFHADKLERHYADIQHTTPQ